MPVTDAFLATCRTAIDALAELAAYRAALVPADSTTAAAMAAWVAVYRTGAPQTLHYQLLTAIRAAVLANATAAISTGEREQAYRTLSAEYVAPIPAAPVSTSGSSSDAVTGELRKIRFGLELALGREMPDPEG